MYDIEAMKQITSIMKMAEKVNKSLEMGQSVSVRLVGGGKIFDTSTGEGEMAFSILNGEYSGELDKETKNKERYAKLAAKFFSDKTSWIYSGLMDEVRFFEDEELVAIFMEGDFAN